ncbi:MAG: cytochrome c oxidase, cbb3-type, CcoQ subunit [Arcobacter sp.]|nr:MAG: cytochrome c oxidase, cbb3-type, CcoQ subunit [Arcobacter sp.]
MSIGDLSAYGYFILTVTLSLLFMAYVYHVYSAKAKGTKDYEKYGDIALHDELTDKPVEEIEHEDSDKESSQDERKR